MRAHRLEQTEEEECERHANQEQSTDEIGYQNLTTPCVRVFFNPTMGSTSAQSLKSLIKSLANQTSKIVQNASTKKLATVNRFFI